MLLVPDLGTERREIDRDLTEKAHERTKTQHEKRRQLKILDIKPGDMVRVKGPDGKFADCMEVSSVGQRTLTTVDGKKCP